MPKSYEELLGLKKEFVNIPKIAEVSIERLHPPPIDITPKITPGGIDFSYLANNSSFQRAIMEFIKKFVPGFENVKHRGSMKVMKQSFDNNAHNYKNCMVELKEKLKERRDKIDDLSD